VEIWQEILLRRRYERPWLWVGILVLSLVAVGAVPTLLAEPTTGESGQAVAATDEPHSAGAVEQAGQAGEGDAGHGEQIVVGPNFVEFGKDVTPKVLMIVLQLAVILAAAKVLGWIFEAVSIPGVLGELAAGMLLGPYFLGQWLKVYVHFGEGHAWVPLFPPPVGVSEWPVSDAMWAVAVIASIVLLFIAGLHTNLKQFMANLAPATVCAIGGVVAPFLLGAWTVTLFTDHAFSSPEALFMGAIMVATSVGITARVLQDIRRLDTPEGVTILGGAVVDDVLGILVLSIVVGIVRAERAGSSIDLAAILITTVKAVGVWIGITSLSLLFAPQIEKAFEKVKYAGARVGLGLALAFLCAGIAEMFGLAFIIGAYSVGLGLSRTKMAEQLMEDLKSVNDFIVPIFFAAMGMLVNFGAMKGALLFGLVISVWAVVSKIFGCGLPALIWFNKRGAARIGMGMLPRGEVALIVAGVGLAERAITQQIFGVSILMTLVTTVIAPIALVPLFKGRPGKRGLEAWPEEELEAERPITIAMPRTVAHQFLSMLVTAFERHGFEVTYRSPEEGIYQLQKNGLVASIGETDGRVSVEVPRRLQAEAHEAVQLAERWFLAAVRQIHEISAEDQNAGTNAEEPSGEQEAKTLT